jgi:hypothetical protein
MAPHGTHVTLHLMHCERAMSHEGYQGHVGAYGRVAVYGVAFGWLLWQAVELGYAVGRASDPTLSAFAAGYQFPPSHQAQVLVVALGFDIAWYVALDGSTLEQAWQQLFLS